MSKSKAVSEHRRRTKERIVYYLGGKCILCGYNKCNRALHAHHVDPTRKEFGIAKKGTTRSWKKLRKELDKCVLVCANCHSEIHSGQINKSILSEALRDDLLLRNERAETIIDNSSLISKENKCVICNTPISRGAKHCLKCNAKVRERIQWPTTDTLLDLVNKHSYLGASRILGVSDNAIRKRLKKNMG